tara:strand:+ start:816 stop:1766 length:951 start_codon:yes stop_codon:yes gene_type:complete
MDEIKDMGRRPRVNSRAKSRGKNIILNANDDLRLLKLHTYGHLPVPYLHAFTRDSNKSLRYVRQRLNTVRHEEALIFEPMQQLDTSAFRGNTLIYGLHPKGEEYLKSKGLYSLFAPVVGENQLWIHDFTASCVCASLELAAPEGYTYQSQPVVLDQYNACLSFPVSFTEPGGKNITIDLKPDRMGQINTNIGKSILVFLEVERSKKQHQYRRGYKTTERNGIQYYNFIARRQYMEYFGKKSDMGAMTLFLYWDAGTMMGAIDFLKKVVPNGTCKFMLFKYLPNIKNHNFKPPPILKNLWDEPWLRIGHPPIRLTEL